MTNRRWPVALAAVVAVLVVAGGGFAIGRSTAPESAAPSAPERPALTQTVDGVTIGVVRSRTGALAASDNYVAAATQNVVQDPSRYEQLVRSAYAPSYQQTALDDAKQTRQRSPRLAALYGSGGKTVVLVGARRLDSYDGVEATTTSWVGGVTWGGPENTQQSWNLIETTIRWDGQRWLVTRLAGLSRPAPTPRIVGFATAESRTSAAFERELRGMTAPVYGGQ